jgi:hypothetical protein
LTADTDLPTPVHQASLRIQRPLTIGLTGRAGSGKSTVAQMLADEFAFTELAFADPILEMVSVLFATAGIDGAWAADRALKELPTPLGFSYRQLAQSLGTEWGRGLHPDLWLRVMAARKASCDLYGENLVISDVRFPNEAQWITSQGGVVVRVLRHDLPDVRPHASESHVDTLPITTELLNYGSKATLFDQVDRLVSTLRKL